MLSERRRQRVRCSLSSSYLPDEGLSDGLVIPGELGLHVVVAFNRRQKGQRGGGVRPECSRLFLCVLSVF